MGGLLQNCAWTKCSCIGAGFIEAGRKYQIPFSRPRSGSFVAAACPRLSGLAEGIESCAAPRSLQSRVQDFAVGYKVGGSAPMTVIYSPRPLSWFPGRPKALPGVRRDGGQGRVRRLELLRSRQPFISICSSPGLLLLPLPQALDPGHLSRLRHACIAGNSKESGWA